MIVPNASIASEFRSDGDAMRRAKVQQQVVCASCDNVIEGAPAFCGVCGRPTPFATYEDQTAYEVAQWRAYSHASEPEAEQAATRSASTGSTATAVIDRLEMHGDELAPWQRRLAERESRARARELERASTPAPAPTTSLASQPPEAASDEPAAMEPVAAERVTEPAPMPVATGEIDSRHARSRAGLVEHPWRRLRRANDDDRPVAYRRCLECGASDWVLRAGGHEDDMYRYWCVRCGLAFYTDLRIRHAAKPWLLAAIVVAAIALATMRFA
jgi:hypothetical protein